MEKELLENFVVKLNQIQKEISKQYEKEYEDVIEIDKND